MSIRSVVTSILVGVTAAAVPAAAMEVAKPSRPVVEPKAAVAAAAKAAAPAASKPVVEPKAAVAVAPAATEAAPKPVPPAPPKVEPAPATATTAPATDKVAPATVAPKPVTDTRPPADVVKPLRLACEALLHEGVPGVHCKWSPLDGAAHYVLFRKTADGAVERIYTGTELGFGDRDVRPGTGYGYGVKAVNHAGKVIGASEVVRVHCCGEPTVDKPVLRLACEAGLPDGVPAVRCTWSPADGAVRYDLYRKAGDGTLERLSSGADTSFVDRTVTPGTSYSYGVKAFDAAGRLLGMGGIVTVRCCGDG